MKNIKHPKIRILASIAIIAIISVLLPSNAAFADDDNTFFRKAALATIHRCYDSAFNPNITNENFTGRESILSNPGATSGYLPTGLNGGSEGYTSIDCKSALNGVGSFPGMYSIAGVSDSINRSDTAQLDTFMQGMGYKVNHSESGKCISLTYTGTTYRDSNGNTGTTRQPHESVTNICANNVENGVIKDDNLTIEHTGDSAPIVFSLSGSSISCRPALGGDNHNVSFANQSWSNFATSLSGTCGIQNPSVDIGGETYIIYENLNINRDVPNGYSTTYTLDGSSTSHGNAAISYLSGNTYRESSSLALTDPEKRELLQNYLDNFYQIDKKCGTFNSDEIRSLTGNGYVQRNIIVDGAAQSCYVKPTKNNGSQVLIWGSNGQLSPGRLAGFSDVTMNLSSLVGTFDSSQKERCNEAANAARARATEIINNDRSTGTMVEMATNTIAELDKIIADHGEYWNETNQGIVCYSFTDSSGHVVQTPSEDLTDPGASDNTPDDTVEDASDLAACFSSASSLGWILCPVAQAIGAAADGIYSNFVEDFLNIHPSFLNTDSENGVYQGWKMFRDAANIGFAIILAIVVLSQVTGFGVSNYGIKKILPSLIVTAVLVNLSYFLCQAAVDLSNIVGSGVKTFLESLPSGAGEPVTFGSLAHGLLSTVLTGTAVFAGVRIALQVGDISWVIGILLALVGVLIAALAFLLILGFREAVVIVGVMLSPLAIICYALPNTKNLFTKWWKIFSAMLLIYPICGVLMGGSNFVSSVLLHNSGGRFFMSLVAVLVQVVPIAFIPGLVRSSFSMLGNLGARISTMGRNLSSAIGRGARGSDIYKDTVESSRARSLQRRIQTFDEGRSFSTRAANRLRSAGFTEVANSIEASGRRRANRTSARYEKARKGIIEAEEDDRRFTPDREEQFRQSIAEEHNLSQIRDMKTNMVNDPNFNTNDLNTLSDELRGELAVIDFDPEDQTARNRAAALSELMMQSGPMGQDRLMTTLKDYSYGKNSGEKVANGGVQSVLSHLNKDGKNRAILKSNNYGDDKFISDYLGSNNLQSRDEYINAASKASASAMSKWGDQAYADIISNLSSGKVTDQQQLEKLFNTATTALSDPRISGEIKPEVQGWLNDIRKHSYDQMKKQYVQNHVAQMNNARTSAGQAVLTPSQALHQRNIASDNFVRQFGAFRRIDPADSYNSLHIAHPNNQNHQNHQNNH